MLDHLFQCTCSRILLEIFLSFRQGFREFHTAWMQAGKLHEGNGQTRRATVTETTVTRDGTIKDFITDRGIKHSGQVYRFQFHVSRYPLYTYKSGLKSFSDVQSYNILTSVCFKRS